jgi:hypothetical protein
MIMSCEKLAVEYIAKAVIMSINLHQNMSAPVLRMWLLVHVCIPTHKDGYKLIPRE